MKEKQEHIVRIAVRAFLQDPEERLLILKRSEGSVCSGWWVLPGGKVGYKQTAEEAVKREVLEETGLICTTASFLFYMDNLPTAEYDFHFVTLFFKCKYTGNLRINNESSEYHWLDPGDSLSFKLAFEHDMAINRYKDL